MVEFSNPISNWLKENRQKALKAEAYIKIRISDYITANDETITALLVDGIFVQRVTPENILAIEKQLKELRTEYINKNI